MNFNEFFSIKVVIANSLWRKTGSKKLRSFLNNTHKKILCVHSCYLQLLSQHRRLGCMMDTDDISAHYRSSAVQAITPTAYGCHHLCFCARMRWALGL